MSTERVGKKLHAKCKLFPFSSPSFITSYVEEFTTKPFPSRPLRRKPTKNGFVEWEESARVMSAYNRSMDALKRFYCSSTYQENYCSKLQECRQLAPLFVPGMTEPTVPKYSVQSTTRSSYGVPARISRVSVDLMRYGCNKDRKKPVKGIVPGLLLPGVPGPRPQTRGGALRGLRRQEARPLPVLN